MLQNYDRLTTRVFDSSTRSSGARLDAYRDGDSFVIDIDLPGVDPAGIDVTVDRKVLIVRAERKRIEKEGVQFAVTTRWGKREVKFSVLRLESPTLK